jgi:hypothetical protein
MKPNSQPPRAHAGLPGSWVQPSQPGDAEGKGRKGKERKGNGRLLSYPAACESAADAIYQRTPVPATTSASSGLLTGL